MRAALALALVAALSTPRGTIHLHAQSADPAASVRPHATRDSLALALPFGPGERMVYQVKLGVMSAGEGYIGVDSIESVLGHPTYRLSMGIKGGVLFAKVNDRYDSWLDTRSFVSRHFISDVHEVRYKNFKEFMIYPEERRWQQIDEKKAGPMATAEPLDELGFIFWLRTLPLEVGDTYTSNRYFKDDGNPVVIKVLRKEKKKVPAGEFETVVVQPLIRTKGLFSEGGKAEIYLSDDAQRRIVYLRSEIPVVGSVTLHLKSMTPGVPLNPSGPPPSHAGL
jgi:hypothetical protein